MSERRLNRAVQYGTASAEATQDSSGKLTVTARATFSNEGYSATEQLHLTLDAALELRAALDDVLP